MSVKNTVTKDFMLHTPEARRLYHDYAEMLPIIDYHCHLSAELIAKDHTFADAAELFLGGDHYKWRAMRSFGIEEKYITGDASGYEKFMKFAEMIPYCIGNPLYHWTHLELKRYFGVDEALCPETADKIWNKCNEMLKKPEFSAKNLIINSKVEALCTTDDPADTLEWHKQIRESGFSVKVLPTFRPDKAMNITAPTFRAYIDALGVKTYDELLAKLSERIDFFAQNGCKLSDHSLERVAFGTGDAGKVFDKVLAGEEVTAQEEADYRTGVLLHCAREYARRGWTMQLHIGAMRNNNSRMFARLGADAGFDSINDLCIAESLSRLLDALDKDDLLPKTILYTLNPKDNYVLGTMLGNFQQGPQRGKIQFGSGWWFNDQRDGMENQMRTLANLGLLSAFVGMLTDSRSFVSYPRHEYFRRIFCNVIGQWVHDGEYPEDWETLGRIVRGVCHDNAAEYFGF